MSEKHQAACRLLQAAHKMQALLTEETDGTPLWQMIRSIVSNARVIEMSIAIDLPDDVPDEDETDEGMFGPAEDPDS